jgi:hypothetical protein
MAERANSVFYFVPVSGLGQSRTFGNLHAMSAVPLHADQLFEKADIVD